MPLFVLQANAQDKMVTGKVTNASGAPVAGATIKIKGGKSIGSTNSDGTFSLKVPANATLEITSVGFATAQMSVPTSGVLNFSLQPSSDNLDEIVVIGYGTAKKKDLTGSIATVTSKDFVKGQLTTPEQLISGKVAGVSITANGGAPGSGSVIRIRGGASLNASNDPLIVIDGVPIESGNSIAGSANALSLINPNEIESFSVLKDASAAAIYGSRASNGVIIITTKRGLGGPAKFNFSSMLSVYQPSGKIDVLNADQFKAFVNANGKPSDIALLGTASTDWQKEIYRTAIGTDNNLSMSGAIFGKTPFRASLGYLNQQGILRGGNLKRTTASFIVSPKFFNNTLKIDLNVKGVVSETQFANEGAIGTAVGFDPTKPIYSGNNRFGGYWEWLDPNSTTGLKSLAPINPVGLLNQRDDQSHVERSIGSANIEYQVPFINGLKAVVNLGYDILKGTGTVVINDSAANTYKRFIDGSNKPHGGVNNVYRQNKQNTLMDAYLNYNKSGSFGDLDLTAGYSYQAFKTTNYNFADKTFDGTTVNKPVFPYDIPENRLIGFYGRLKYAYKGKYLLTATIRRDGSSRFTKDNRWGTFPSVALGWKIKDEFFKNTKAINDLKIRVGYGVTGNQDGIPLYLYQPTYAVSSNQSQYQFGSTFYNIYAPAGYNSALKWEQTEMLNAGIDFALFNNRVTGTVEYYERKTKDLLNDAAQPAGSNFTNRITANVGDMKNRGVELTLNLAVVSKRDFTWDLGFNINYNKNEITNLTIAPDPTYLGNQFGGISGGTGNTILINSVGYPRGSFFVYKQIYDPKTGKPIDGLFEDLNRDGIINSSDLYQYKQVDPVVFMGINSNFTYRKWNGGFVMRANVGNYMYNNVRSASGTRRNIINPIGILRNGSTEVLESNQSGDGEKYYLSDYWVQNASFLRMDNINIGYNVGKVFNNKASLRLTANVQNVFVITKYKGLDPEISGGIDNNLYVRPRVFVFGVNLDF